MKITRSDQNTKFPQKINSVLTEQLGNIFWPKVTQPAPIPRGGWGKAVVKMIGLNVACLRYCVCFRGICQKSDICET